MTPSREPAWRRYLRFLRDDVAADVEAELEFHVESLVEELVARGIAPGEARRQAAARMGDIGRARAETVRIGGRRQRRERRQFRLTGFRQDLHYALRSVTRAPAFSVLAVLTLALGIGASVAVFSVLDGVVLRPLPYAAPDRLVRLWEHNLPRNHPRNVLNPQNVLDWWRRSHSLESMAIYTWSSMVFTDGDQAEWVIGKGVTTNYFDVLGVPPALGRTFVPEDSVGSAPPIVISQGLWTRRFGGDSGIVGRAVGVAGGTATVIGVMPARFRPIEDVEYWSPRSLPPVGAERRGRYAMAIARLADGVTASAAQSDLRGIARTLEREWPDFDTGWTVDVIPLRDDIIGDARLKLFVALGAVTLVLLIACANVANLVLVRAAGRRHEMGVRAALGAARGRLLRLWLAECTLLALSGVLAGLGVAWVALHGVIALAPPDIPRLGTVTLNGHAWLVASGVAVFTALALALVAAYGTSVDGVSAIHEAGTRHSSGVRARRFRGALVIAQVAFALILLQGAGLLVRTLRQLEAVNPGIDPSHTITADLVLPTALYHTVDSWNGFFTQVIDALRAQPGVTAAGYVSTVPLGGPGAGTGFVATDRPEPPAGQLPVADIRVADEGYFRALRIPLVRGRLPDRSDDGHPVVVVNEALAREMWPDGDALGKALRVHWLHPDRDETIVGVVGNTSSQGLDVTPRGMIYYRPESSPQNGFSIVARGNLPPAVLEAEVREVVRRIDPTVPLHQFSTMEQVVRRSLAGRRSPMFLLTLLSALALVLAVVGLYGVLSYAVRLRVRELGVRVALGARPGSVIWLVVRDGLALTLAGGAVGTMAALAATRVLRGLLFGLSPTDPVTITGALVIMAGGGVLASAVPAWRASRLDPASVMRAE